MAAPFSCDVAIVGGGLAGGLIALALSARRPELDVRLIEGSGGIGGNHVWSFFATDIAAADRWLVAPLVSHQWPHHDVVFPGHARTLKTAYHSIESEHFDAHVRSALGERALLGRAVAVVSPTAVVLADGDTIAAGGVIDCRGPADLTQLDLGWQKFLGRELALDAPHGQPNPIIMDASVAQIDGYRFVYTLPFAATRMFVEDTYYSDTPDLDADTLRGRISTYADARGWIVERVVREETGVLPVAMGGDFDAYWRSGGVGVAKAGMRAGLFHPMTGYTLPDAVRTAALVCAAGNLSGTGLHDLLHRFAARTWQQRGYDRMLATMLFRAAEPAERYRVLERFYRLDADLITRFYAGRSTLFDRVRVLTGKPPVPIGRAIAALWEKRA